MERVETVNADLAGVWEHMRDLGLGALAHANRHASYAAIENERWPELSVLQAAHAGELLLKARIAQEHPLLVFDQLPRSTQAAGSALTTESLMENGRTIQWSDIPERLWATTGLSIPNRACFDNFGKLRNVIQHFVAPKGIDVGGEALRFIYEVIDPFVFDCWGLFAVDFDEDYEEYIYLVGPLVQRELLFRVSPQAASTFADWDVDWSVAGEEYRAEMTRRVRAAGG